MREVLKKCSRMIEAALLKRELEINSAYLGNENGGASIGLRILIEPGKSMGQKKLTAKVKFIESQVDDTSVEIYEENQRMMGAGFMDEPERQTA